MSSPRMLGDIALVDGKIVDESLARVPVDDIAFTYGYGVYEHLKVRNRQLFYAPEHLDRLLRSAQHIGLPLRYDNEQILTMLHALIEQIPDESFNVKLLAVGERLFGFASHPHYLTKEAYRDGVSAITVRAQRAFPQAKTLSMLTSYLAYAQAKEKGAYDALLEDNEGFVHEGTRTNLFIIANNHLITAPCTHALAGVTRLHVLASLGDIMCEERPIATQELLHCEGAMLSSTSSGLVPLRSIDGTPIPISPLAREVMRRYSEHAQQLQHLQPTIIYQKPA